MLSRTWRNRTWCRCICCVLAILLAAPAPLAEASLERPIVIGCKQDVEGQVLAEIMAQLLENRGFAVERRFSLGGTLICFEALKRGAIDVYPEYSGTIEQAILQLPSRVSHDRLHCRRARPSNRRPGRAQPGWGSPDAHQKAPFTDLLMKSFLLQHKMHCCTAL